MSQDYTRRHDLFVDAHYEDPGRAIRDLFSAARAAGLPVRGSEDPVAAGSEPAAPASLEESLKRGGDLARERLGPQAQRLLELAPEWLFQRGGDLTTLLWLARQQEGQELSVGAFALGLGERLLLSGRRREAAGLMRFLGSVDFDFGQLYAEPGLAYGFFQPREPNPFVWKILHHVADRSRRFPGRGLESVKVLELGCGIGNDALGFLGHDRVRGYIGTDLSPEALVRLESRAAEVRARRPELTLETRAGNFTRFLTDLAGRRDHGVDLVYSYSSLHYFASEELQAIFHRVKLVLEPGRGLFAFAIKGEGSIWDGQGVPLYRPDVWVNCDGQSRWFPSREAIISLADRTGYELRLHEWYEHWGYSEAGQKDLFHYVICSPRR